MFLNSKMARRQMSDNINTIMFMRNFSRSNYYWNLKWCLSFTTLQSEQTSHNESSMVMVKSNSHCIILIYYRTIAKMVCTTIQIWTFKMHISILLNIYVSVIFWYIFIPYLHFHYYTAIEYCFYFLVCSIIKEVVLW